MEAILKPYITKEQSDACVIGLPTISSHSKQIWIILKTLGPVLISSSIVKRKKSKPSYFIIKAS